MSTKVLEIKGLLQQDDAAAFITQTWNKYNMQRAGKVADWAELRNYIFATDTRTTSNASLPWKNSTTTPKLCQIRDNLHSNYISSLFPNDNWLSWEAYTRDAAKKQKAKIIEGYMENKCREAHFRTEMSKCVYDYIDYGNAFCTISYESKSKTLEVDGSKIPQYVGPRLHRISPLDIVFNPLADTLQDTFKIIRSIKTLGEVKRLAMDEPENAFWTDALEQRLKMQQTLSGYRYEDFEKATGYQVDGFGSMYEYLMGNYMEILEFYGDYNSPSEGLEVDRLITIVDRKVVVRNVQIPTWLNGAPIWQVGWRFRQDNLWAMGPLDNLVGMQYRIDHLENAKADAYDLVVQPPLLIAGDVEQFVWGPSSEIYVGEGGSVTPLSANMNAIISADNMITALENKMELYAGAPRDAMGIRTPGEKTAFEVNTLMTAAGRIFQEKSTQIEVELLEPALNGMLESARRNMDGTDLIRVIDTDYNAQEFISVTRDDITASGIIRPVGARHFAKQQQDLQNLVGVFSSPIGQMIAPHTSALNIVDFINDVIGLKAYNIFQPNVAIMEQAQTKGLMNQAEEDQQVKQATPMPPGA